MPYSNGTGFVHKLAVTVTCVQCKPAVGCAGSWALSNRNGYFCYAGSGIQALCHIFVVFSMQKPKKIGVDSGKKPIFDNFYGDAV